MRISIPRSPPIKMYAVIHGDILLYFVMFPILICNELNCIFCCRSLLNVTTAYASKKKSRLRFKPKQSRSGVPVLIGSDTHNFNYIETMNLFYWNVIFKKIDRKHSRGHPLPVVTFLLTFPNHRPKRPAASEAASDAMFIGMNLVASELY